MARTIPVWVVLFVLLTTIAGAQEVVNLDLQFKNIDTDILLANIPLIASARSLTSGITLTTVEPLSSNGSVMLQLSPGNWELEFRIQDPQTQHNIYYLKRALYIQPQDQQRTLYLIPVGGIQGKVFGSDGDVVTSGELTFDCTPRGVDINYPDEITPLGTFEAPLATPGECTVTARSEKEIGAGVVIVEQGKTANVEIHLKQPFTTTGNFFALIGVVLLLFIVATVLFFRMKERWKHEVKHEMKAEVKKEVAEHAKEIAKEEAAKEEKKEAAEESELNPRARDIMKTLNDKEKTIVEFILKQSDLQASQAQCRNNTGIPKTSLARIFQSLESKNVVAVTKIGNMKKVKITDWFMGKD